ncbi:hypothetical protein EON65_09890 [archaeon]|nr:MAG: hypothetical protein EON65_09890 [archaeon]
MCIEVEADVTNPTKKAFSNASVHEFVEEKPAESSVLPNNVNFKSNAGQMASSRLCLMDKAI